MNKKIRDLETKIIALLNSEPEVQIEVKRLIISNIYSLVSKEADKIILLEMGGNGNGLHENELAEHTEHADPN